MSSPAILITQCLQHDFVAPIGRYEPLPNLLHIGFEEARRLLGENPAEGPVARTMAWAYQQADSRLGLIHIRDWHNPLDPAQQQHLKQFGEHCVRDTAGAEFAFAIPDAMQKKAAIVDASGLNDFLDTTLAQTLADMARPDTRFGIAGVWTEAKISFLAYELRTRFPESEIAVCSALTASSSRSDHFLALEHLKKILGVRIIDSVGGFVEFLGGEVEDAPLLQPSTSEPVLELEGEMQAGDIDRKLLSYLFRDCSRVRATPLSGGFSGNLVLGCEGIDRERRKQVPHVIKIGPREAIGRERASFEQIEHVLGNVAPRITDFADWGERGAIKYRYASMGGGITNTLQRRYMEGMPHAELERIFDTVFAEQLARLYSSSEREAVDLFDYYAFSPQWAPSVRKKVEALIDAPADEESVSLPGSIRAPNICSFYENRLATMPRQPGRSWWFAHVHGDLNGANIILDANSNVWLIDFFHAHRGHILKDLIKLENDLLYIWTKIDNEEDFVAATRLTDQLLEVRDLAAPLPPANSLVAASPTLLRAWESIRLLRKYYPALLGSDRDALQLLIGQLRYAVHTLGFDECNRWQRLWALYAAGQISARIEKLSKNSGPLRVDWLSPTLPSVGLTLLPGRKDYGRNLSEDMAALRMQGATHLLTLVTADELAGYGVETLSDCASNMGISVLHEPIIDQQACATEQMNRIKVWIDEALSRNGRVVIHCVAGLGRSGMVAAAYLSHYGHTPESAIQLVRTSRSPRALETAMQEEFVHQYAAEFP
ncbi:MAG: isochorismatase family protein [Burkholderiales bacterium]|nr:isochorismatase family protein [Burkholderiales bacterium]